MTNNGHKLAINPNRNFPWTVLLLHRLLPIHFRAVTPVGNSHLALGIEVQHSLNFQFK